MRFLTETSRNRAVITGSIRGKKIYDYRKRFINTKSRVLAPTKLSYFHGVSNIPLSGKTVGQQLQDVTEKYPDKISNIFYKDGVRVTYSELLEKADACAAGLLALGFKRGDRLGIWGPNTLEWLVTMYAAARAGLILVNINPSYLSSELKFALQKVQCKGLVASVGYKNLDYERMLSEIVPDWQDKRHGEKLTIKDLPDLEYVFFMGEKRLPGSLRFDDLQDISTTALRSEINDLQLKIQFDDFYNIQFTSGTTGSPKGATLTHHNLVNNAFFIGRGCSYHEHEAVICIPVPLYHCFGMVLGQLASLVYGGTCVFPSPVFDPEWVLKSIEATRCTSLYGVPTMFIDVLHHPVCDKTDTSSLDTGIMAGSPCPIETMKDVVQKLKITKITVAYGSTETSPISYQTPQDATLEQRVSTVGILHPHNEGKIIDSEGRLVPVGEQGELCTRGYNTMPCYWEDQEKTDKAISPTQWYHTGDLAVFTEDGYCSIVGRIKDMLIRGGENIYPLEIEQTLYKHPKIKDVQVIGVPDERLGEQVCAWIQIKQNETLTEEEVKKFCRDKMARFKIPEYILFVDEFPTTVNGKIQKFIMRKKSIEHFDLKEI